MRCPPTATYVACIAGINTCAILYSALQLNAQARSLSSEAVAQDVLWMFMALFAALTSVVVAEIKECCRTRGKEHFDGSDEGATSSGEECGGSGESEKCSEECNESYADCREASPNEVKED